MLALLGENGAGKTTLMNILFGHYVADEGSIEAFGESLPAGKPKAALARGIGMVHQHFTLADNLTVLDNVMLGTEPLWRARSRHTEARAKLAELSETFGLAVKPDARIADLSVGERQRVEILKALYRDARILILDEPTAVLTPQETEALFATLQKLVERGLAIIFISHKLHEVMAVSRRVVVLRQGKLVAERRTAETDRHELAELMVGRPIPEPKVEPIPLGPVALSLRAVTLAGEGRPRLQDVSLELHGNEIVGIAGVSGNGQGALGRPRQRDRPAERRRAVAVRPGDPLFRSGQDGRPTASPASRRTGTPSAWWAICRSRRISSPPAIANNPFRSAA